MLRALVNQSTPLPSKSKLLILGAGFSGQYVAKLARALGTEVICSRRTTDKQGAHFAFDSSTNNIPSTKVLSGVTHLLSCIPPDLNGKDPVLIALEEQLRQLPLKWAGYLSTTGVYGDCKGKWAYETDNPKPIQERSKRRLACEMAWLQSGLPIQILRLPGIYGPGRSAIESLRKGQAKMVHKPGQIFSRVHVNDIAGAIFHLIHLASQGIQPKVINVADNIPSTNIEVLNYASKLLKCSPPPIEPFETACATMSPMAVSFWQENRRVSNKMLCKELGYKLIHPDYKSGLKNCLMNNILD